MSDFAAYVVHRYEAGTYVRAYTPGTAAGETFVPGEFVSYDTTNNWIERAGTDPTLIAGISETSSEAHRVLTADGKVPIRIIEGGGVIIAMSSSTTPAASHIGDSYGITRASNGHWQLDVAKTTTSSRVRVVDVDITNGIFYVQVHANLLQFADVEVATV